jgi:hypothetical protein
MVHIYQKHASISMKLCVVYTCGIIFSLYAENASVVQHSTVAGATYSLQDSAAANQEVLNQPASVHDRTQQLHSRFLDLQHPSSEVSHRTVAARRKENQHSLLSTGESGSEVHMPAGSDHTHQHWSFVAGLSLAVFICLSAVAGSILWSHFAPTALPAKHAEPTTLAELYDTQTIDFKLPESVFGDAVLQFTICSSMHSTAIQNRTTLPWIAWSRSLLCGLLILGACFLQIYVAWNLDVKLSQQRFGLRSALKQCELPLAASCSQTGHLTTDPLFWPASTVADAAPRTPDQSTCCTKDQVCGEVSWKYFCSDRPLMKNLATDPWGTNIWSSMACGFQKVSETYYEYEDTVYARWPWLVSCVLLIWLCMMAKDVRTTFLLCRAVTSRPKVALASEQVVLKPGQAVEIVGMVRETCFAILVFVVVPKFLTVVYITYVGARLLISTSGVLDLVLDGIALTFIVEADQVLFYGFTGSVMREVLRKSQPFKLRNLAHKTIGVFGYDVLIVIGSLAIMLFIIFYFNHAESRFMGRFIEAACAP